LEVLALGSKIGFAIHFQQYSKPPPGMDIGVHQALGSLLAGAFHRRSQTLLAQQVDGFVHFALRVLQSLFAIHHSRLGLFP
jgi:hypothetical protein